MLKNLMVLGSRGQVKICSGTPSSLMTPSQMKSTRSDTSRAKPISCVTMRIVMPAARQLADDAQHLLDHLRVERGCRLVKEHDLRFHRERPHDGETLLLAAGELAGVLARLVAQPHALQEGHRLLLRLCLGNLLLQRRRKRYILEHRHIRKDIEMLEHHADALAVFADGQLLRGDILALEEDLPLVGRLQQVQAPQERRLAAAAGADDGDDLAPADPGGDALEHLELSEALFQIFRLQDHISH